jgi:hypothetical protein
MGIGFPHDHLIADCGLGVGGREKAWLTLNP